MKNYKLLKSIHQNLKYKALDEFIGREVLIDISSENLIDNIISLLVKYLNIEIERCEASQLEKQKIVEDTFRKLGILDLSFEVNGRFLFEKNIGLKVLKDNGWIDESAKNSDFSLEETYFWEELNSMNKDILDNNLYLKVFAVSQVERSWRREKAYLVHQLLQEQKFHVKEEDKVQLFKVSDLCLTNYKDIWLWKHFYL